MAFLIAIPVFMRGVKKDAAAGSPVGWADLRRELARAMGAYLRAHVPQGLGA
jgi:hypothetical protein